jgi:hypothetical protein
MSLDPNTPLNGPIFSFDNYFAVYYDPNQASEADAVRIAEVLELARSKLILEFSNGPRPTRDNPEFVNIRAKLVAGVGSFTTLDGPIVLNGPKMADPWARYHEVTPVHELMHRFIYNYGSSIIPPEVRDDLLGIKWMTEGIASWAPIWVNNLSPGAQKIDDAFKCLKKSVFMRVKADGNVYPNDMYGAPFWIFTQGLLRMGDDPDPGHAIRDYLKYWLRRVDDTPFDSTADQWRDTAKAALEDLYQEYLGDPTFDIDRIYNEYVLACTGPFWRMAGSKLNRVRFLYENIETATGEIIEEYHEVDKLYDFTIDLSKVEPGGQTSLFLSRRHNAVLLKLTNSTNFKELHVDITGMDANQKSCSYIVSGAQINVQNKEVAPQWIREAAVAANGEYSYYVSKLENNYNTIVIVITRSGIWPYQEAAKQKMLLFTIKITVQPTF